MGNLKVKVKGIDKGLTPKDILKDSSNKKVI